MKASFVFTAMAFYLLLKHVSQCAAAALLIFAMLAVAIASLNTLFLFEGLQVATDPNLSFEEAAALSFGGTTVLRPLRDRIGIKPDDKVLVIGTSGGVGTAAVQIARHLGAEVTGVCSTVNIDLVRSLGAGKVIDYTREDFAQSGDSWDVIVDTTGSAPFARCEPVLRPGGRLLIILGSFADAAGFRRPSKASGKSVIAEVAKITVQDLRDLAQLASIGAYRPVIDRSYPLELAAEAHAYVDTGRKRGNVVLSV